MSKAHSRSPLFRLEVRHDGEGHATIFLVDTRSGAERPPETELNTVQSRNLPDARRRVFEILWAFSEQLDQKRLDLSTKDLRPLTDRFLEDILALQGDVLGDSLPVIQEFVRKRAPHLLNLNRGPDKDAPFIEILGGEDILFECLPFFVTNASIAGDARRFLSTWIRQFLGMSVIVRRTHRSSIWGDVKLLSNPHTGVPVKFFQYEGTRSPISFFNYSRLQGATTEKEYLSSKRGEIDLEEPWPMAGATPAGFVSALFRPNKTFAGTTKSIPDQIHHFSCHFDSETDADDSRFRFCSNGTDEIVVRVGAIKAARQRLLIEPNRSAVVPPLAIVNACSSARDRGLFSLHEMFSRTHRGMIGTQIDIPDKVAAELSKKLYEELLDHKSLGLSLLRARQFIVDKYCNPLGLAYTLHADPDLKIVEADTKSKLTA